jgi:hypothetical protein
MTFVYVTAEVCDVKVDYNVTNGLALLGFIKCDVTNVNDDVKKRHPDCVFLSGPVFVHYIVLV